MDENSDHHMVSFGLLSKNFPESYLEVDRGVEVNVTNDVNSDRLTYTGMDGTNSQTTYIKRLQKQLEKIQEEFDAALEEEQYFEKQLQRKNELLLGKEP